MMYRAICVRSIETNNERVHTQIPNDKFVKLPINFDAYEHYVQKREIDSLIFPTIVDCYKYVQETYTKKDVQGWHCKMLWPVLEDFQKEGETLVRVAYTDDLTMQCWIQMIEDESEPIPHSLE